MKAVIVRFFVPFEQAEYGEGPEPSLGAEDVVVKLEAIDVNFPDILYIEGKYQNSPPMPFSPGLAGAGTVLRRGSDVTGIDVGQRVLVIPSHGTYAQQVVAPAAHCFPLPAEMPFTTAAAMGLVYQTAYFALLERGGFKRGDVVLVLGASGGIGMAAVQLAKALGAGCVIATSRSEGGRAFAKDIGADLVVDAASDNVRNDLRDVVFAATGGKGADIVIDPVGGDLSAAAIRATAWNGRLVVVGFASGSIPKIAANYLLVKNISASGLQWTDYRDRRLSDVAAAQQQMFDLWRTGMLAPRIFKTLPLSQFAEALRALRDGAVKGKIVLTTNDE